MLASFAPRLFQLVTLTLALISLLQSQVSTPGDKMSLLNRMAAIDGASTNITTEADALAYVNKVANCFNVPSDVITPAMRQQFAAAEFAALNDKAKWVSEIQLKSAVDELLRAYGVPELSLTTESIHNFRLRQSLIYPRMFGRTGAGQIQASSRPIEAALLLFLIDFNLRRSSGDPFSEPPPPSVRTGKEHVEVRAELRTVNEEPTPKQIKYEAARRDYFSKASPTQVHELIRVLVAKLNLS